MLNLSVQRGDDATRAEARCGADEADEEQVGSIAELRQVRALQVLLGHSFCYLREINSQ